MRRFLVSAMCAAVTWAVTASDGSAQAYQRLPYDHQPGNAGIMGVGPGGREAYHPMYYSTAPYYGVPPGGYGYGPGYYAPNITGLPSAPMSAPDSSYRRTGAGSRANVNVAVIDVKLPEGARLWVQDKETRQRGGERFFESPPLEPGKNYTYKVKVQWVAEDGKKVERTRTVRVRAGSHVTLDWTRSES